LPIVPHQEIPVRILPFQDFLHITGYGVIIRYAIPKGGGTAKYVNLDRLPVIRAWLRCPSKTPLVGVEESPVKRRILKLNPGFIVKPHAPHGILVIEVFVCLCGRYPGVRLEIRKLLPIGTYPGIHSNLLLQEGVANGKKTGQQQIEEQNENKGVEGLGGQRPVNPDIPFPCIRHLSVLGKMNQILWLSE